MKNKRQLKDFMEMCGQWNYIYVVIWDDTADEVHMPLYTGPLNQIPYWIALRNLDMPDAEDDEGAIDFCPDLGPNHEHKAGLIIYLEGEAYEYGGNVN